MEKSLTILIKKLIYIAGPTGIGKTSLSILIAKRLKTEILSCDSRQIYKEMSIGTGVPSIEEQQGIKHHFIHNKSIHKLYDAYKFEKEGLILLKKLFKKHDKVVMVGGSGLYAKALIEGLDEIPEVGLKSINSVKEIYKKKGLKGLQLELKERDPIYYKTVDLKNHRRLIRALEVCKSTQKPYSSFLKKSNGVRFFKSKTLLLKMNREKLYNRINHRVDKMISLGLIEEAKSLFPYKEMGALQTVGYKELFDHFERKTDIKETIELIKKNTRNYAKRQLTWFNKIESISVETNKLNQTIGQIIEKLN